ncbi:hypothetical protein ABZ468_41625 [Streptomyces sp. NPDC005708]|uniref:hypothetical protein n=1 Tax=Streptomyces sp. NPDC005708 TaxID=3154564 RepID=UPI0033C0B964
MSQELATQEQFDAFADEVARMLGTHCRTGPLPQYARGLARLVVDGDGRALRLCRPDGRRLDRLKVYAALPDETHVRAPSIGVTASSADHVARKITRRLYPLHAQAVKQVAELTAKQQAEAPGHGAVADALAGQLPGARVSKEQRRTRVVWRRESRPSGEPGHVEVEDVCAIVGPFGNWVQVEATGRPNSVIPMLAAFAQADRN